ncbi:MAG: MBOAT family protein [Eubacterium sp.]|nr:MBOAT family protein [Eubacterium sp.]
MLFSSMIFLWVFLPIVLILYYAVPGDRIKNIVLLAASLVFYAWGEPVYILLMLLVVGINYVFGMILSVRKEKWILALGVAANLAVLGYYKYFDFGVSILNRIAGRDIAAYRSIGLPLGISFFTFQALSYMVDVYRGDNAAQKNYFRLLLYVSLFPQLVAGPIVKYHDVEQQLAGRTYSWEKEAEGVRRFIYGLAKKVLLSNTLALYADSMFNADLHAFSSGALWVAALLYTFQIYFDFSGYSDMAIGLGKLFGFDFKENFRYPYVSGSVREFWRRWHISLSTWFKEYVYIPLGGNRKGSWRTYRNLLIVFFTTGLWHGASTNFIVWGLYHGFFLILERAFLGKWLDRSKAGNIVGHVYTAVVVILGWVIFRIEGGMHNVLFCLRKMLSFSGGQYALTDVVGPKVAVLLLLAFLLSGPLQSVCKRKVQSWQKTSPAAVFRTETVLLFCLLFLCFMMLVSDTYNPFIYFRF